MNKIPRLSRDRAAVAVIDMQEGFRPIMAEYATVAGRIATMVRGARELRVPVIVTEQYPKGLKATAPEIIEAVGPGEPIIEKTCFSACGARAFTARLEEIGARQVLLTGIEAHICVTQTALDLLERGFDVFLILDCITSRHPLNKEAGIARLTQAGVVPCSLEMALFELMGEAGTAEFKAIQKLVK